MKEGQPNLEHSRPSLENENKKNVYGREAFSPERAKEQTKELSKEFQNFFESRHYRFHDPVPVSSGIDPTVRFIGSHISVFKPFLLEGKIPGGGLAMEQPCIRTRNVQSLFDDKFSSAWGSYFSSFGTLSAADRLGEASSNTFDFLKGSLAIAEENIRVRVSSQDVDLLKTCKEMLPEACIESDTKDPSYYRHAIGADMVKGRNFNIALRNADGGDFSDIGNVILFEREQKETLGVEVALGASVILKQLYGLAHVLDCYPVPGLEHTDPQFSRKLQDAILVSALLTQEGLKPAGSNNRERILRTYIRSLSYLRSKLNISLEHLKAMLDGYAVAEFQGGAGVSMKVFEAVERFEDDLMAKEGLSKEEEVIKTALFQK
jgi:hypothetical protein